MHEEEAVGDADDRAGEAGLDINTVRLLALLDVIEPADGACGFRDLIAAREVARLGGEGVLLADILASLHVLWLRDHSEAGPHLARVKLTRSEVGGLVMKLGAAAADLDGRLRLPMGEGEEPRIDDLFAAAETAEKEGDLDRAEVLYRRCLDIDRSDPTIPSISPTCCATRPKPRRRGFISSARSPSMRIIPRLGTTSPISGMRAVTRRALGRRWKARSPPIPGMPMQCSISPRRTCGAALMAMRCDVSNATSRSIWAASGARAP